MAFINCVHYILIICFFILLLSSDNQIFSGIETATSSSLQDSQKFIMLLKKSRQKSAPLFNSYYITMPTDHSSNVYKRVTRTEFKRMLYDAMNSVNENMELIFFDDMLRHAENLCRALVRFFMICMIFQFCCYQNPSQAHESS